MGNLGLLSGIGAAVCWGSYFVLFKKANSDNFFNFQFFMAVGILIAAFFISLVLGYSISLNIAGLISGSLWAIANVISLFGVRFLGMSKSIPIMSSLVVILSFLFGSLFFGEMPSGIFIGLIAVAMIILGVCIVSLSQKQDGKEVKRGTISAILAGVIFGCQFVPIKSANIIPHEYFFSMSVGIFLAAAVIFALKFKLETRVALKSLFSGGIWTVGNLLGVWTISLIGLSRGLPITQLSVLIGVCWGIFYFKEIKENRQKLQIFIGACILVLGVFILSRA